MEIILIIIKCFILIVVGTLVFFIGQGLVVLFIFFLGCINDHSRNNDDVDEDYYKVDKQKKKEIQRKELKKIDDEYERQITLYNTLLSGYNMPKSFYNELIRHLPVYLYSQKKKGLIKEEEYRRRIGRWFGLIEGYFPETPKIKTGDFETVDHEDPYYRMGYENGFNEGMRVSFDECQKTRP